ncbi:hypothetical protein ACJMK2_043856 [Sinanodonta woodiana]|uniref:Kinesin motor domain-containing protein n=1 Tax=Sinanodonta woodiana TaxID=1069815 RepID=A0ABD3VZY1_SINWO
MISTRMKDKDAEKPKLKDAKEKQNVTPTGNGKVSKRSSDTGNPAAKELPRSNDATAKKAPQKSSPQQTSVNGSLKMNGSVGGGKDQHIANKKQPNNKEIISTTPVKGGKPVNGNSKDPGPGKTTVKVPGKVPVKASPNEQRANKENAKLTESPSNGKLKDAGRKASLKTTNSESEQNATRKASVTSNTAGTHSSPGIQKGTIKKATSTSNMQNLQTGTGSNGLRKTVSANNMSSLGVTTSSKPTDKTGKPGQENPANGGKTLNLKTTSETKPFVNKPNGKNELEAQQTKDLEKLDKKELIKLLMAEREKVNEIAAAQSENKSGKKLKIIPIPVGMEGLRQTKDELRKLQKEFEDKHLALNKAEEHLKNIKTAAKEGEGQASVQINALEREKRKLTDENRTLQKNYNTEKELRQKYFNQIEELQGKIRVYCRPRPLTKFESDLGNRVVVKTADKFSITLETDRGVRDFQYYCVFPQNASQNEVFDELQDYVTMAVEGYNTCIFSFGQAGAGKTYTMIGDAKGPGLIPQAFKKLFAYTTEHKSKLECTVTAYMLELYNDKMIDLFSPKGVSDDEVKMDIRKDRKGVVSISGITEKEAPNQKKLTQLFEDGLKLRHTISGEGFEDSSMSHMFVGLKIKSRNITNDKVCFGKLTLVDLAGGRRVPKSKGGAEQVKEALAINKSISDFGSVVAALASGQSFAPYRNNKLTMLMQDILGGNCKTAMLVNVSPTETAVEEALVSLSHASRVRQISNEATKITDTKEVQKLKNIIAKLKKGEQIDEED